MHTHTTVTWADKTAAVQNDTASSLTASMTKYLFPESELSRPCIVMPDAYRGGPETAAAFRQNEHYCIAGFDKAESWKVVNASKGLSAHRAVDSKRQSDVLVVEYDSSGHEGSRRQDIRLTSPAIGEQKFDFIQSVRLWIRGNGSYDQVRVFVADRTGEMFTHARPLILNFEQWALEELSFASGHTLSHGGNADGVMDPPLTVREVLIKPSGAARNPEIRFDRLSVIGASITSSEKIPPRSINGAPPATIRIDASRPVGHLPLLPSSIDSVRTVVTNSSKDSAKVLVTMQLHRVFGDTQTSQSTIFIGPGGRETAAFPTEFSIPGWYRAVICARVASKAEPVCLTDDYLVWRQSGNEEFDNPMTFFGAMTPADRFMKNLHSDLALMKQAGVRVLRFPFRWTLIEPEPGQYSWDLYDQIFAACRSSGITPQPIVLQTPVWARRKVSAAGITSEYKLSFLPPRNFNDFKSFVSQAARRYAKYSPYWEIWNEPYARQYWLEGTKEDYISLLRAGHEGIKSVDAGARVLSAGTWGVSGYPREFTRHLIENGSRYFDIFAVHSHGSVLRLFTDLGDVEALWQGHKQKKPFWLNETGVTVDPARADGELVRASETVKKMTVARARGVENFGWFVFRNNPESSLSPFDNYPVMDANDKPRPVILAYNNVVRWLRNTQTAESAVKASHDYESYTFRGANRRVTVVWAQDPETSKKINRTISRELSRIELYDLFGGSPPFSVDGSIVTFKLTGYPLFFVETKPSN